MATGPSDVALTDLNTRLGAPVARAGAGSDAVDGVVPRLVVEPQTPANVGGTLAWATESGRTVIVRGGGTKIGWGPTPTSVDVLLSMRRMSGVEAHRHGDLTATVRAGTTLSAVNAALAEHRQWLALDPPDPDPPPGHAMKKQVPGGSPGQS